MTKLLSAEAKAEEVGVSLSGLRKTRHLYKHIKKSPRKYLYYAEDPKESVRPNMVGAPDTPVNSRKNRRRNVPFGHENYHKAPGGSGNSLQRLNQLRSKIAYEGKIPQDQAQYLDEATEETLRTKSKEVIEAKQFKLRVETQRKTEDIQRAHLRSQLSGIYTCSDMGRKYPYTNSQYYENKEKVFGPTRDSIVGDHIRRRRETNTSFFIGRAPYGDNEKQEEPEEGPTVYLDDKGNLIGTVK